jgi:hypothetical protein
MQGDFHRKKPTYVATNSSSDYLPTTCNLHWVQSSFICPVPITWQAAAPRTIPSSHHCHVVAAFCRHWRSMCFLYNRAGLLPARCSNMPRVTRNPWQQFRLSLRIEWLPRICGHPYHPTWPLLISSYGTMLRNACSVTNRTHN